MKAVVLARGLGRRMRASDAGRPLGSAQARAAEAGAKVMMPVGGLSDSPGRPFLDYVLASLADAGFTRVGVVVAPDHDEIRERYSGDIAAERLTLAYLVQAEPRGTADAVLAAEAWAGDDPFVVVNADNLYPVDVLRALATLDEPGLPVFERDELVRTSNIPADRVAAFALVTRDETGYLASIIEKPGAEAVAAAGDNLQVSMNCWRFDPRIFDACRDVPRSVRGEFELPEAVALALERGVRFATVQGTGEVLDLSRRSDVAEVSRRLAGAAVRL